MSDIICNISLMVYEDKPGVKEETQKIDRVFYDIKGKDSEEVLKKALSHIIVLCASAESNKNIDFENRLEELYRKFNIK